MKTSQATEEGQGGGQKECWSWMTSVSHCVNHSGILSLRNLFCEIINRFSFNSSVAMSRITLKQSNLKQQTVMISQGLEGWEILAQSLSRACSKMLSRLQARLGLKDAFRRGCAQGDGQAPPFLTWPLCGAP